MLLQLLRIVAVIVKRFEFELVICHCHKVAFCLAWVAIEPCCCHLSHLIGRCCVDFMMLLVILHVHWWWRSSYRGNIFLTWLVLIFLHIFAKVQSIVVESVDSEAKSCTTLSLAWFDPDRAAKTFHYALGDRETQTYVLHLETFATGAAFLIE